MAFDPSLSSFIFIPPSNYIAPRYLCQHPLRPTRYTGFALKISSGVALIFRYTRPQMASIWSEENKYRNWLRVELAATDTLVRAGMVPAEAATALHERASFTVERIHEIEAETRHDVLAFTQAVAESVCPEARWLH